MTDYQKLANDFLTSHNLTFRAVLVGSDCPTFCEDAQQENNMDQIDVFPRKSHIHGKHYRCTISGDGRGHVGFDFWNSYADEEQNAAISLRTGSWALRDKYKGKKRKQPTAYDLLACIQKSDVGSFDNFCSEFGYDTDSRRAEEIYRAVVAEYRKVARFFTSEEIQQLQEIS